MSNKRQPILHAIPPLGRAQKLVDWTLENWGPTEQDWLREGKFELKVSNLGGKTGNQALLLPLGHGRKYEFRIVLNEEVKSDEAKSFLIAHEIAHSFFYSYTDQGKIARTTHIRPYSDGVHRVHEKWCDHYAKLLLGMPVPRELELVA